MANRFSVYGQGMFDLADAIARMPADNDIVDIQRTKMFVSHDLSVWGIMLAPDTFSCFKTTKMLYQYRGYVYFKVRYSTLWP